MAVTHKIAGATPSAKNGPTKLALFVGEDSPAVFTNYTTPSTSDEGGLEGRGIGELRSELFAQTGNWPRRLGRQLFVVRDDH